MLVFRLLHEELIMSKGMDQKKSVKKKAAKTFDEKRAAKKAKKAERSFLQRP
jgi:hypothetical protein